jgi:hypothetical protein
MPPVMGRREAEIEAEIWIGGRKKGQWREKSRYAPR